MTTLNVANEELFDDHKIIRVRTKTMKKRDYLLQKNKNANLLTKAVNSIKLFFLRITGYIEIIMSRKTIQKSLVNEYLKVLSNFKNVDVIIPTCYPFESVLAAQKYKTNYNNSTKIIPFLFDKYSESPTLHRNRINKILKYKRHLLLEEEMIQNSEKIFYVDSWVDHMKKYFLNYDNKLVHVEHPLIVECCPSVSFKKINIDNSFIDIVYTGVLDKKVRPPFKTLKVISKIIEKDSRFRFHFYVLGNCGSYLKEYQVKYPGNIFNHGQVKSDIALAEVMKSNILLSIGNTDVSLIPSKIFEYMSCGKPIIHFYNSEEDSIVSMLKVYGLGYSINQNESVSENMLDSIIRFCDINRSVDKPFSNVKESFFKATPQFISEKIVNSM